MYTRVPLALSGGKRKVVGMANPTHIRPHGFNRWAKVTDAERQAMRDAIDAHTAAQAQPAQQQHARTA